MDDRSLLGAALEAVRDTLVTLAHTLVWPPAARRYCERCNVPPITLESDWSDGVTALSDDWEGLGDAEKLAQVLLHLEGIYHATDAVLDHEVPYDGIVVTRRYQVARDRAGKLIAWCGRSKRPGVTSPSLRIAFDDLRRSD